MTADAKVVLARIAVAASAALMFTFFAFIVGPGIEREWNEPKIRRGTPDVSTGTDGWLDPTEAPAEKGHDIPPVDPSAVLTPRPELLARGRDLYRQNCMSCHGETGHGDGVAAKGLNPAPRNFTQPGGWTNGTRITDIFKTISSGVAGTGMTAFDYILPADRMALVHYVRSLGAFDHGPEDPAATAALAAEFRKAGGRVPNRIPVSEAIAKLAKEAPRVRPLHLSGAPLLAGLIVDPERAARTLADFPDAGQVDPLPAALAAGAPENGFRVEIATLGPDDWRRMRAELAKAMEARR
jgi:mono/diheme cytochrome c family protein